MQQEKEANMFTEKVSNNFSEPNLAKLNQMLVNANMK
jgi:hypothetical protein